MEKVISTKNLACYRAEKEDGKHEYLVCEKATDTPIMTFTGNGKLHHLTNTIPLLIEDYKYYKQVCEIVSQVMIMEGALK